MHRAVASLGTPCAPVRPALINRPWATLTALALLLCAGVAPLRAQLIPPNESWRTFTTERFDVHFVADLEPVARRAAAFAEQSYTRLEENFLPGPRGRIQLVVMDNLDLSNAFAGITPMNVIGLYARPPAGHRDLGFYDEWIELAILHELVHIFQLNESGGYWPVLQAVFGRFLFYPNMLAPGWIAEGLAVHFESKLTSAGRLRDTTYDMIMRTAILAGAEFGLDNLSGTPVSTPGPGSEYYYGALFIEYLARTRGDEAVRTFVRSLGRQPIPFVLGTAPFTAFGAPMYRLWDEWIATLRVTYEAQAEALRASGITEPELLTSGGGEAAFPRYRPDGSLSFVSSTGREQTRLMELDRAGRERTLSPVHSIDVPAWDRTGAAVIAQLDFAGRDRIYSDLYRREPGGRLTRLTRGARLTEPSVHPSGGPIAAIQAESGMLAPVLLDPVTLAVRRLAEPSLDVSWSMPRWSPTGDRLAVVRTRLGGFRDLVILDPGSGEPRVLVSDRSSNAAPAWSPDGRYLVFSSDRDGINDLYAHDLASGETWQITRVLSGAFEPDVSPDGRWLAFSYYRADGYAVARLPFDPSTWRPAPPVRESVAAAPRVEIPALSTAPARRYSAFPSILPRVWLPTFGHQLGWGPGIMTFAIDALFRTELSLEVQRTPGGRIDGEATWDYAGLGNPTLGATVAQRWSIVNPSYTGPTDETTALLLRQRSATLGALFLMPSMGPATWASVQADLFAREWSFRNPENAPGISFRRPPLDFGARLSGGFRNTKSFRYSISNESGFSLAATLAGRSRGGSLHADSTYGQVSSRGTGYLPLALWGFSRHVLAGAAAAAASGGSDPIAFTVGGTGSPGEGGSTYGVRGTHPGVQRGNRALAGTLEYRFPIHLVERGAFRLPIFLDRVSGALFTDAGTAWCEAQAAAECAVFGEVLRRPDPVVSAGAELVATATAGYFIPFLYRVGVAAPLRTPRGEEGPRFYAAFGRTF